MPTNSTLRCGAITSRSLLLRARSRAARSGRAKDVAARLFVRLKLDQPLVTGFLQQIGERAIAVVSFVEAGIAPLERLLHHRAPDLLVGAALGDQRLERAEEEVIGLLLLVVAGRRGFLALLRRAAFLLVGAHQVVIVDELVAVVDEKVGARVLDSHADDELRVLAQL